MIINEILPLKHKYLQIVTTIAKPPKLLYYIGSLPAQRIPTIAVVGTRKPTQYGREVTERLVYDLAHKGVMIVSGLALGVDALAHSAALDANGRTVAILPCGLPKIAPATNHQLAHRIVERGGAIISEYKADQPVAWKSNMLARNRLVAGLADGLLITEASARSGTLNTAGHALEQGKHVFVVPGNITSPQSAGCNALLKQGATPVTCAEDILEIIAPQLLTSQAQLALGSNPLETSIIEALKNGLRDGDDIQRTTTANSAEFNTALTMLELAGTIKALGANQWTLR
ncbi:MAG: DNA-processing protein DprA [Candidatus Saccharimonas sp.]